MRKTLKPVYESYAGWSEDISTMRQFEDLPANAQRYVAGMAKAVLDVAYERLDWPADDLLPNLRYLGVGPEPSQIIKDVPAMADLIKLA